MSRSNCNLKVSVLLVGGKPEENLRSKARTNNKLNPNETASTGIKPESEMGGLATAPPTMTADRIEPH